MCVNNTSKMSILITNVMEDDIIAQLYNLALSNSLCDFEATLRFISNSRYFSIREVPDFILECNNLREKFSEQYLQLLEKYSAINFSIK
jgi:hypothetical protein